MSNKYTGPDRLVLGEDGRLRIQGDSKPVAEYAQEFTRAMRDCRRRVQDRMTPKERNDDV